MVVHISVVNQTVTLGKWVGHETLVAFPGIGTRRGGGVGGRCDRRRPCELFVHIRVVKQKVTLGNWAGR